MAKNALTHPACSFDRLGLPNYSLFRLRMLSINIGGGRRGRNRMVVGFTTTYAISVYHH